MMRKPYIDNIRSWTIALVVLYHVIYMFNSIPTAGVIGPIAEVPWLDGVQYLLYPWFMLILFLLSGMCSRYSLQNRSGRTYLRARTVKLLVPSTVGLLVFGWAQGYLSMAISHAFDTLPELPGPVWYLLLCISGTGVLWTIQVMWVLSVVLLAVRRLEKGRLLRLGQSAGLPALLAMGVLIWASAQVLNTPMIPVYRLGLYGTGFLLGYFVLSHEEVVERLSHYALPLLAAALGLGAACVLVYYGQNYAEAPVVNSPLSLSYAWMMCLAVLGCFRRWGNKATRLSRFAARKSFGLYVFHYLALSAAAYRLAPCSLPAAVVYLLVTAAAFGGGLALYELFSRIPILRWCLLGLPLFPTKQEGSHHVSG